MSNNIIYVINQRRVSDANEETEEELLRRHESQCEKHDFEFMIIVMLVVL